MQTDDVTRRPEKTASVVGTMIVTANVIATRTATTIGTETKRPAADTTATTVIGMTMKGSRPNGATGRGAGGTGRTTRTTTSRGQRTLIPMAATDLSASASGRGRGREPRREGLE